METGTLDIQTLTECFEKYMAHGGTSVSRAHYEANLQAKLAMPEFTSDLPVILSADAVNRFDVK